MYLDLWWGDLRFAWRAAARRPAFTALVVLTLALGLGVNSAVFALLDTVLLKALPYRDPSRLVFVWQTLPQHNIFELEATPFDYAAWHGVNSFSSLALIRRDSYTLAGDDESPERVRGSRVTSSLMPLLGIAPRLGRGFSGDEDANAARPVVVLSDGLWRRRYGGDPAVLGRSVRINAVPHTVVGIMPQGASLPGPLAGDDVVWLPARMTPAERDGAISHNYTVVARLAEGVSFERASAETAAFAARMAAEHPDSHGAIGARLVPVAEQTVRAIRPTLLVIGGGVALLLLVACANAATLLIARAASHRHEIAVRAALGATEWRLFSQAAAECLVYSTLGGVVGLALGRWALRGLLPLFAASLPPSASVDVDGRAALFTMAVTLLLGIVFGCAVAFQRPRTLANALSSSSRTIVGGSGRSRTVLVVAQVTLAVVLLSAAGLMLTSVTKLSRVSPGFNPERMLTFKLALTGSNYAQPESRIAFTADLLQRLKATAGVRSAALTSQIPFGGTRGANGVAIEGRPRVAGEPSIIIDQRHVTPDYFQTMGVPLLKGRGFTAQDDSRAERVTVINRTMAERYWANASPIDQRVRITAGFDSDAWFRIVGVVEDVRHLGLNREPVSEMYRPYAQAAVPTFNVLVRTAGEPSSLAPAARAGVLAIDPGLPVYDVRTMEEAIAASFAQTRGTMLLLLVTASLATALAGVAIYGSIWYSVSQRLPEIGIRLALGATRASVFADVLRSAVWLTCIGAALGTAGSIAAGRLIAGLLFDTPSTDPATHAAVVSAVLVLALVAGIVPAHRAMSVDPMETLRN
jgi:putative ABC transport system permease protein